MTTQQNSNKKREKTNAVDIRSAKDNEPNVINDTPRQMKNSMNLLSNASIIISAKARSTRTYGPSFPKSGDLLRPKRKEPKMDVETVPRIINIALKIIDILFINASRRQRGFRRARSSDRAAKLYIKRFIRRDFEN